MFPSTVHLRLPSGPLQFRKAVPFGRSFCASTKRDQAHLGNQEKRPPSTHSVKPAFDSQFPTKSEQITDEKLKVPKVVRDDTIKHQRTFLDWLFSKLSLGESLQRWFGIGSRFLAKGEQPSGGKPKALAPATESHEDTAQVTGGATTEPDRPRDQEVPVNGAEGGKAEIQAMSDEKGYQASDESPKESEEPPAPSSWSRERVLQWAVKVANLDEEDKSKFSALKLDGKALLRITEEKLISDGIPRGPAVNVALEVEKLKGPLEPLNPVAHLRNDEEKYHFVLKEILPKVEVSLPQAVFDPQHQANLLGAFNKPGVLLPFRGSHLDMRLMGAVRDPLPAAQRILKALSKPERYFGASIGVSGAAKTTAIFDVAMRHFVVFMECMVKGGSGEYDSSKDLNFMTMVEDLERLAERTTPDELRKRAKRYVRVHILARLLYLRALFEADQNLTPLQYLLGQTNGGQTAIGEIFRLIRGLEEEDATVMLGRAFKDLKTNFFRGRRLVAALDEANVGAARALSGKFLSPSGKPRGLLTPINIALAETVGLEINILWAGTAFSLLDADSIQSDIGKAGNLDRIVDEYKPEKDPLGWIGKYVDISGCDDVWSDPNVSLLKGRFRLSGSVISHLAGSRAREKMEGGMTKSQVLRAAIRSSVDSHRQRMYEKLLEVCSSRAGFGVFGLVRKLTCAALLSNGRAAFVPTDGGPDLNSSDLVHTGICQLESIFGNRYQWVLAEELAILVCRDVIRALDKGEARTVLQQALRAMDEAMLQLGNKSTTKGNFGELVLLALMVQEGWQGKTFAELDVVRSNMEQSEIPAWMHKVRFQADRFGTARQLGFEDDMAFFKALINSNPKAKGAILQPAKEMHPDGLWMDSTGEVEPNQKLWYSLTCAFKMHWDAVGKDKLKDNLNATDLRKAYHRKDGAVLQDQNRFHELFGDVFHGPFSSLGGMLRIHVELPYGAGQKGIKTGLQTVPAVGATDATIRDVSIHINLANVKSLVKDPEVLEVLQYATGYIYENGDYKKITE